MSEPKLMTQYVQLPDGSTQEIKVKSIGAEILAKAAKRKAARQAARAKKKTTPPTTTP